MIRPAKGPAVDVALCAAVAGVTGLVYSGFYAGWPAVPVILGAAAVPALLVLASVRPGWPPGRAAGLAGAGLALYPVLAVYWGATSAGLPGPAALGALGRGLVDGWGRDAVGGSARRRQRRFPGRPGRADRCGQRRGLRPGGAHVVAAGAARPAGPGVRGGAGAGRRGAGAPAVH